jgi:transposase InsO family protein
VAAFCREHDVSTSWFYKVLARARAEGQIAALEVASTRPKNSPNQTPEQMIELALNTRTWLQDNGFDHGPLSVAAKLRRQGLQPPSRATLARIFARAGVVTPEPKKKPRSAMRRFVYPAPNCCWQIDATEWTLAGGRVVVIFQLIDDHSRLALASLVADGETAQGALTVVRAAIARHGVPQKFLSDNGRAFNPTRMGQRGQLVGYLTSLGVAPITGKPYKPTTQGKNERVHQTLMRYLNKQPPAQTTDQLQDQVDTFDQYYNTHREHQALTGRTPQEAWDATPKAEPPTPPVIPDSTGPEISQRTANRKGIVNSHSIRYQVGEKHAGQTIHIVTENGTIAFYDTRGTHIINHPIPARGTTYVGNGKPRGFMANRPHFTET